MKIPLMRLLRIGTAHKTATRDRRTSGARASCRASICFAAIMVGTTLTGCSRTVSWQEEVPLNTGETIWIERSMPWALKGGFGNPFDIAMRPTWEQAIRFNYGGKTYTYSGRANVRWIAISPAKQPVLVARAADHAWDSENQFFCIVPHYVQLMPDDSGTHWTWPEKVEPWLYNLPANVMANIPTLAESRLRRYTSANRDQRDATYRLQSPTGARIDPLFKSDACITKT